MIEDLSLGGTHHRRKTPRQELLCPYCAQPVNVHPDVDVAEDGHSWIEDCSVCCHPITFTLHVDRDGLSTMTAEAS